MCTDFGHIPEVLKDHKISDPSSLKYGTAGFRCTAKMLQGVAFRLGILASFRSLMKNCKAVGVMITASHNPPEDNGMKLIDPDGGMLDTEWEPVVVSFVQCTEDETSKWLSERCTVLKGDKSPCVLLGYDTRESSPNLANELKQGVNLMNTVCLDLGLVSTPQLHYAVRYMNLKNIPLTRTPNLDIIYIQHFVERFVLSLQNLNNQSSTDLNVLHIDCAHGVGSVVLNKLKSFLLCCTNNCSPQISLCLHNTNIDCKELLNQNCGADFVKLTSSLPKLDSNCCDLKSGRWATIDGDADRLLYFQPKLSDSASTFGDVQNHINPQNQVIDVELLDGDRIACLFASFIVKNLDLIETNTTFTIGVIQTAYANSSSTNYLTNQLNVSVMCVPTGVKHLHHAAQNFDFGIYFEANGHGTVLFSNAAEKFISSQELYNPLRVFADLTNTAIGDAITDLLLVEYVLAWHNWSLIDWIQIYTDLPSKQIKQTVAKPQLIQTTNAERTVAHPAELQIEIDKFVNLVNDAIKKPGLSRAFVRPSGTENIVRIYTESLTFDLADWLAKKIALSTCQIIGYGTGSKPLDPGPIPIENFS